MHPTRTLVPALAVALAVLAPAVATGCAADDAERPPLATTTTVGPQPTVTTTLPEQTTTTTEADGDGDDTGDTDEAGDAGG